MTLDDVRIKDVGELTAEDKQVINTGWENLTTEEKDYFGTVHSKADEGFKMDFKNQKEFDDYIQRQVDARTEARAQEEVAEKERKEQEAKEESFFPKDYTARNWNEAANLMYPKFKEKVIGEIQNMNATQRKKMDEINKEYDQQLEDIANNDPSLPKKGTKAREEWETDVAAIGAKYKMVSMVDAYDVWKALNTSKVVKPELAELRVEGSNEIAKKVGRGYGTGTSPSKTTYKVGGGMRLDEVLEKRKREEGMEE